MPWYPCCPSPSHTTNTRNIIAIYATTIRCTADSVTIAPRHPIITITTAHTTRTITASTTAITTRKAVPRRSWNGRTPHRHQHPHNHHHPKSQKNPNQPETECKAYLSEHQGGKFYDCNDNGRARDAGNQQKCIDNVLGKPDPFGDGRDVKVVHNWGSDGKCK